MERLDPETVEGAEPADGVEISYLIEGERMSAQAFELEPGAAVPEHDHPNEQLGVILEGELTFHVNGDELVIGAGEAFRIPGGEPHAAENAGETVVRGVDVFAPARPADYWSA